MTILMLHSEDSAVGNYRIWQPAKYLERAGHEIRLLPDKAINIKVDRKDAGEGETSWEELCEGIDLMVIQRPDTTEMLSLVLGIRDQYQIPYIYEIDDNIYDISKSSPSYQYWYPGSVLFDIAEILISQADAVTVTTPELAKVFSPLNKNIYVLPNNQDPEIWDKIVRPKAESDIIIGWAGGSSHYDDLELLKRPLKKILRYNPNVKLRIMGTLPDFLNGWERVQFRTDIVHTRQWPKKLAELDFDIGLAPIVERPFNASKSDIKWQEYAMLGIPTIASDFGPYRRSIKHMETGLLSANNEYAWELNLLRLIESEELRRELATAARAEVLVNHNMETNVKQYEYCYAAVVTNYKPRQTQVG